MKRTYLLELELKMPKDTDIDLLEAILENVVQYSTAGEAIDTGLYGAGDRLNVDVVALRVHHDK